MDRRADVAVVGGGILGLAFAWEAARRGRGVVLFERSERAAGASVRNFGMVWPIGQPAGRLYDAAMVSRSRWLELADHGVLWANPCGSVHAVYEADERELIEEYAATGGVVCEFVPPAAVVDRFPAVNPDRLHGALYSPTELCIDPRQAIAAIPTFLHEVHGVTLRYGQAVTAVESGRVRTAGGEEWAADRIFVCSGTDFETLFPNEVASAGIRRCKLQMMRTAAQPGGWRLGPHVAGGLTLGHYKAFEKCRALPAVRRRHAEQFVEYQKFGIHVMASQNQLGEVVIGDSHEYDAAISPFDNERIDALILDYLWTMLRIPDRQIASRWHGVYAKHPTKPLVILDPQPGCAVVLAPGGAGMTLSFGFAAEWWDQA
jgi:FAD dependent oxidoreductase TIGR03364